MSIYRIEIFGDGAGVEMVDGEWDDLVRHVTRMMNSPAEDSDYACTRDMLENGLDSDEGWDGESVHLTFEDGSLKVELMPEACGSGDYRETGGQDMRPGEP